MNILQGIHDTVSKDARASIQDNIDTLLKTNYCLNCNLGSADLTGAELLNATWCNGCVCDSPSKGTCVGCPSVEEVCN